MVRFFQFALLAGLLAGVAASAFHFARVEPLIAAAEFYELRAGAGSEVVGAPSGFEIDLKRRFLSFGGYLLVSVAYALLLSSAMLLSGREVSVAMGLLWGGAGFLVFSLAPASVLTPKLPGMAPEMGLYGQQSIWFSLVLASAGGLALLAFGRQLLLVLAGFLLLIAPYLFSLHLPPHGCSSPLPASLAARFAVSSLLVSAVLWLVLGFVLGHFLKSEVLFRREGPSAGSEGC